MRLGCRSIYRAASIRDNRKEECDAHTFQTPSDPVGGLRMTFSQENGGIITWHVLLV